LPLAAGVGWIAIALSCVAATALAASLNLYTPLPHYMAPIAAAWCVLLTLAARFATQLRWRRFRAGRGMVGLIMVGLAVSVLMEFGVSLIRRQDGRWYQQRQSIERRLADNGKHLILVEYGPEHIPDYEWVYNHADIDAAAVVWARSLGTSPDAELRRYFAGRTVWQLVVNEDSDPNQSGIRREFALVPFATDSTHQPQRP
jgi:hypothetical protein